MSHRAARLAVEARLAGADWALVVLPAPLPPPQHTAPAPTTPPTAALATPAVQPLLQPPAALPTVDTPCRRSAGRHLPHRDSHNTNTNFFQYLVYLHKIQLLVLFITNAAFLKKLNCLGLFCVVEGTLALAASPLTAARFKAQLRLLHLTTHNYHHDTATRVTY